MFPPRSLRSKLWHLFMETFHRSPIHPGWRHPLRFYEFGCILCRYQWREAEKLMPRLLSSEFRDESRVELSPPEYDAEGKLVKHGIVMSATVKRQLDEIMAGDPDKARKVTEVIERIAEDPQ